MFLVNLFAIYLPAILGVTMLIALGFRFFQLKNTGQHLQKKYNSTIKSRICLLLLCILLILTLNFISILNTNFYLYGQDYSQIFIFLVIVYSTQVGTILFEYNKNMPSMKYHKIFWILCLICNIFVAIINFFNEYKDNKYDILGNIVLYLIILNQLVLNCYSLFIRKQDKIEFESISGFGVTVPIIDENKENTVPLFNSFIGLQSSLSQFKILVHFSKTWKIIQQKDGQIDAIITLKIFLQNPNQHYQLKKSITDFIELEKQLLKEDKLHSEIYKLPDEFFRQSNDTHYLINEKLSIIKTYLRKIISKTEYLNQTLQDFLQFDDATKNLINREMRNKANSFDQSI